MASLDVSTSLVERNRGASGTVDLDDAAYLSQVLRLPVDKSESQLDDELEARARQHGITISHSTSDKRYTSSAESASTTQTPHTRTFSTASNNSASTTLTAHSSIFAPSSPKLYPTKGKDGRSNKNLNFSHYERYLAQVDKNLDQPKFRKAAVAPPETSSKSLFSVSTKRSLFSIKSGMKNKMKWRRKSMQPVVPTLFVLSQNTPSTCAILD